MLKKIQNSLFPSSLPADLQRNIDEYNRCKELLIEGEKFKPEGGGLHKLEAAHLSQGTLNIFRAVREKNKSERNQGPGVIIQDNEIRNDEEENLAEIKQAFQKVLVNEEGFQKAGENVLPSLKYMEEKLQEVIQTALQRKEQKTHLDLEMIEKNKSCNELEQKIKELYKELTGEEESDQLRELFNTIQCRIDESKEVSAGQLAKEFLNKIINDEKILAEKFSELVKKIAEAKNDIEELRTHSWATEQIIKESDPMLLAYWIHQIVMQLEKEDNKTIQDQSNILIGIIKKSIDTEKKTWLEELLGILKDDEEINSAYQKKIKEDKEIYHKKNKLFMVETSSQVSGSRKIEFQEISKKDYLGGFFNSFEKIEEIQGSLQKKFIIGTSNQVGDYQKMGFLEVSKEEWIKKFDQQVEFEKQYSEEYLKLLANDEKTEDPIHGQFVMGTLGQIESYRKMKFQEMNKKKWLEELIEELEISVKKMLDNKYIVPKLSNIEEIKKEEIQKNIIEEKASEEDSNIKIPLENLEVSIGQTSQHLLVFSISELDPLNSLKKAKQDILEIIWDADNMINFASQIIDLSAADAVEKLRAAIERTLEKNFLVNENKRRIFLVGPNEACQIAYWALVIYRKAILEQKVQSAQDINNYLDSLSSYNDPLIRKKAIELFQKMKMCQLFDEMIEISNGYIFATNKEKPSQYQILSDFINKIQNHSLSNEKSNPANLFSSFFNDPNFLLNSNNRLKFEIFTAWLDEQDKLKSESFSILLSHLRALLRTLEDWGLRESFLDHQQELRKVNELYLKSIPLIKLNDLISSQFDPSLMSNRALKLRQALSALLKINRNVDNHTVKKDSPVRTWDKLPLLLHSDNYPTNSQVSAIARRIRLISQSKMDNFLENPIFSALPDALHFLFDCDIKKIRTSICAGLESGDDFEDINVDNEEQDKPYQHIPKYASYKVLNSNNFGKNSANQINWPQFHHSPEEIACLVAWGECLKRDQNVFIAFSDVGHGPALALALTLYCLWQDNFYIQDGKEKFLKFPQQLIGTYQTILGFQIAYQMIALNQLYRSQKQLKECLQKLPEEEKIKLQFDFPLLYGFPGSTKHKNQDNHYCDYGSFINRLQLRELVGRLRQTYPDAELWPSYVIAIIVQHKYVETLILSDLFLPRASDFPEKKNNKYNINQFFHEKNLGNSKDLESLELLNDILLNYVIALGEQFQIRSFKGRYKVGLLHQALKQFSEPTDWFSNSFDFSALHDPLLPFIEQQKPWAKDLSKVLHEMKVIRDNFMENLQKSKSESIALIQEKEQDEEKSEQLIF